MIFAIAPADALQALAGGVSVAASRARRAGACWRLRRASRRFRRCGRELRDCPRACRVRRRELLARRSTRRHRAESGATRRNSMMASTGRGRRVGRFDFVSVSWPERNMRTASPRNARANRCWAFRQAAPRASSTSRCLARSWRSARSAVRFRWTARAPECPGDSRAKVHRFVGMFIAPSRLRGTESPGERRGSLRRPALSSAEIDFAKLLQRAVDAHFDGADFAAEQARDVFVFQFLKAAEDEDLALVFGQVALARVGAAWLPVGAAAESARCNRGDRFGYEWAIRGAPCGLDRGGCCARSGTSKCGMACQGDRSGDSAGCGGKLPGRGLR